MSVVRHRSVRSRWSGERQHVRGDNANPIAIDVVQAEACPTEGIDVVRIRFDPVGSVTEDASNLGRLVIIGDTKGIIVDAERDVNDVIHAVIRARR